MTDPVLIRAVVGLGPLLAVGVLAGWRRPSRVGGAALILSVVWELSSLFLVGAIGAALGWWGFEAEAHGGMFQHVPVDFWVGRAIACGALPLLIAPTAGYSTAAVLSLIVDAALTVVMSPLVHLGPNWGLGVTLEVAACTLPAQLIGCWTRDRSHLFGRVVLQLIEFSGIYLIVVSALLERTGGSWAHVLTHTPLTNVVTVLALGVPLLGLGWGGILEFPQRGLGTPLPYDTAPRLITSGAFAYVRNPVQLSIVVLLTGAGVWLASPIVFILGAASAPISQMLSKWDEIHEMPRRYGAAFAAYRQNVRRWLPSWYPWIPQRAKLYVGVGRAADLARSLARDARDLDVVETGVAGPLRYDPCDGSAEELHAIALGRVLEHRNFILALFGVILRLPGFSDLVRLFLGRSSESAALARQS